MASMAAEALAAVESSAPLVGGTAVVSSMASAAATLGLTRRAEKEQTARQRTRLEKLRSEVVKLQELQGQELALLQQQMSAKAQVGAGRPAGAAGELRVLWLSPSMAAAAERQRGRRAALLPNQPLALRSTHPQDFAVAWERVQDDLSRESAERELVQQQLALAQSKVGAGAAGRWRPAAADAWWDAACVCGSRWCRWCRPKLTRSPPAAPPSSPRTRRSASWPAWRRRSASA